MEYPTHCFSCEAVLLGGATRHLPSCTLVGDGLVPGYYIEKGESGSSVTIVREGPVWICHECPFSPSAYNVNFAEHGDLGYHLLQHLAHGHAVPERLFEQLRREVG